MEHKIVIKIVEDIARGLELLGVTVIAIAFLHALIRGLTHFGQKRELAFENLKIYTGKSLQLGLEFLVAADIIRTVTIEPTRDGLLTLGLLIGIRTVLSWSITMEIEGCWPWQVDRKKK